MTNIENTTGHYLHSVEALLSIVTDTSKANSGLQGNKGKMMTEELDEAIARMLTEIEEYYGDGEQPGMAASVGAAYRQLKSAYNSLNTLNKDKTALSSQNKHTTPTDMSQLVADIADAWDLTTEQISDEKKNLEVAGLIQSALGGGDGVTAREMLSEFVSRYKTQNEAAAALGISAQYFSTVLTCKNLPKNIAKKLGYQKQVVWRKLTNPPTANRGQEYEAR